MEDWLCSSEMERDTSCFLEVPNWVPCGDEYSSSVQHYGYNSHFSWPLPFGEEDQRGGGGGGGGGGDDQNGGSKSHNHSQAEKRRRDRINLQLSILRKLIPMSEKMDKAALLASAVQQMKDLKRKSSEVGRSITVPTEADEVAVDWYYDQEVVSSINGGKSSNRKALIRASLCCEDRPEILGEISHALKALKLKAVGADMACLGGRIKSILVLCVKDGKEGGCLNTTIQSLRGVLNRIVSSSSSSYSSSSTSSSYGLKSKRQRFFFSNSHDSSSTIYS